MENTQTLTEYLYQLRHTQSTVEGFLYNTRVYLALNPNANEYSFKQVLDFIGDYKIAHPSNTSKMISSIKKYYDYLIDIGARKNHPCRNLFVKKIKHHPIIQQDYFSSEELELLMNRETRTEVLKIRNQVVISLMIYQGLVTSEITNLKLKDVNLDNGTIYIRESSCQDKRLLELSPKQYRIFDKYISEIRPIILKNKSEVNELLLGRFGNPCTPDDIHSIIFALKGLFPDRNLTSVTIRQSVILNWLNEKKLPLEQVQLLAGHKWISSTERYRCIDIREQRELINKFYAI